VRASPEALFERRLLLVAGKGGTGKSTLSVALAILAARRGLRTVVIELGNEPTLGPLLCEHPEDLPPGDGRSPVEVEPRLSTLRIDPLEALTEYLELHLYVRPVVGLVVRNPAFRRLLDAAPGWRELITLGKLWHLESRRDGSAPRWDLLVVDTPATGHGLSLLSAPQVVMETVRMGPLRRHTDWVRALLGDPSRTLVVPVTLPEELPVRETLELCDRVRGLGFSTGPILVNAVEPEPALQDVPGVLRALERVPDADAPPGLAPGVLARCLDHAVRRARLQRMFLGELEQETKLPLVEVPFLPRGVSGPGDVAELASELEAAIARAGGRT
jgi:anion-transporting  ArsA/GET3 family ATPase